MIKLYPQIRSRANSLETVIEFGIRIPRRKDGICRVRGNVCRSNEYEEILSFLVHRMGRMKNNAATLETEEMYTTNKDIVYLLSNMKRYAMALCVCMIAYKPFLMYEDQNCAVQTERFENQSERYIRDEADFAI